MQMISVDIVMGRYALEYIIIIIIIIMGCRCEETKSPTFVVFFFYEPIIMTTDPENVKVRAAILLLYKNRVKCDISFKCII